jgi:hypothetical protein
MAEPPQTTMLMTATWSAVAASFSALSSFLIMRIQRRNLLESVRPELILTGWDRRAEGQGDTAHEVITFQAIRNVGRGAALNVGVWASDVVGGKAPTYFVPTIRIPIIASNEETAANGTILVYWKNVEPDQQNHKYLFIRIKIFCSDCRSMLHETRYDLFAEGAQNSLMFGAQIIAPGVALAARRTITRPLWLHKLFARLGSVPVLGRPFRRAI